MEGESNDGTHKKGARWGIVAFYKKRDVTLIYKYKDDVDYNVMCHFIPRNS